jgi:hypothetical protein
MVCALLRQHSVLAFRRPNVVEALLAIGHEPVSSRVWTLADNGKEMVESAIRHLPDGAPYVRKFHWMRK